MEQLVPQIWMLVPRAERDHLAIVFGLVKNGVAEIKDQDVISDGHTMADLAVITAERMAEYVGSMESFSRLWELTVAKARAELNPPKGVIQGATAEEPTMPQNQPLEEVTTPHAKKAKGK